MKAPLPPDRTAIAHRVQMAVFELNEALQAANEADLRVEMTENTISRVGRKFRLAHYTVNVMEAIG